MPDFSAVIKELCNGSPPPEWLEAKLEHGARFIARPPIEHDGVSSFDFWGHLYLQACDLRERLRCYAIALDNLDLEVPLVIEDICPQLDELMDFTLEQAGEEFPLSRGGPKVDSRKRICALLCLEAWEEIHGKAQPHSVGLWAACDAYWRACGHLDGEVKWRHFLETAPNSP
jgi:hypothetical protein